MEAGFTLLLAALLIGIVVGVFIERKCYKSGVSDKTKGILNVDCSDPANVPYLYLELTTSIADVADNKQVVFDVHIIK